MLGDHYGSVLDRAELALVFDTECGAFCVRYYAHQFPIEHQAWHLANWRVASDEINYRRFFDVNELVGYGWKILKFLRPNSTLHGLIPIAHMERKHETTL